VIRAVGVEQHCTYRCYMKTKCAHDVSKFWKMTIVLYIFVATKLVVILWMMIDFYDCYYAI